VTTSNLPDERVDSERPRPRLNFAVRVDLAETPGGWLLTLHADAPLATALRAAGIEGLPPGRLTFSVTPNLVPGQPFEIQAITVSTNDGDH
jgi:hypothetical protein